MNFSRKVLVHIADQNTVGGIVALPPTHCLRAAHLSVYAAARVDRTGSARRRHPTQIGPMRRKSKIRRICPRELSQ